MSSGRVGTIIRKHRSALTVAAAVAIVSILLVPVAAPDVLAPADSSTTVTVTTISPRVNKCYLKATGPNNLINLEANATLSTNDNNRTNTQVRVNRVNQGSGVTGDGADNGQNNSLYFLVNVSATIGDNGAGGIDDVTNITVEAWWEDQAVASSETQYGYGSSNASNPGKNNHFRINFTTNSKSMGGPTNESRVTWPVGITEGALAEVRVNHLGITGNAVRRGGTTQLEVGLPVQLGPNIRWARNATDSENNSDLAGLTDPDSWNYRCIVQLDADPATGFQSGVFNDPNVNTRDLWEFSTYKYSSLALSGVSPTGAFAPGAPETAFPCNPTCTTIDYKSNAPFNFSVNISNLGPTTADCGAGPTCIDADDLGIDLGQMTGTGGAQGTACAPNECYRFDWDRVAGRTNDGFLWMRGANGTGALRQNAAVRWQNITCGSEEHATLAGSTCSDAEDQETSWFSQVALGTLEGTYSARVQYRLATHANPSPRSQSET